MIKGGKNVIGWDATIGTRDNDKTMNLLLEDILVYNVTLNDAVDKINKEFVPDLPEELRRFILGATQRNPADRYKSISEALVDLEPLRIKMDIERQPEHREKRKMISLFLFFLCQQPLISFVVLGHLSFPPGFGGAKSLPAGHKRGHDEESGNCRRRSDVAAILLGELLQSVPQRRSRVPMPSANVSWKLESPARACVWMSSMKLRLMLS